MAVLWRAEVEILSCSLHCSWRVYMLVMSLPVSVCLVSVSPCLYLCCMSVCTNVCVSWQSRACNDDTTGAAPFPNAWPVLVGAPSVVLPCGVLLTLTERWRGHSGYRHHCGSFSRIVSPHSLTACIDCFRTSMFLCKKRDS